MIALVSIMIINELLGILFSIISRNWEMFREAANAYNPLA